MTAANERPRREHVCPQCGHRQITRHPSTINPNAAGLDVGSTFHGRRRDHRSLISQSRRMLKSALGLFAVRVSSMKSYGRVVEIPRQLIRFKRQDSLNN